MTGILDLVLPYFVQAKLFFQKKKQRIYKERGGRISGSGQP